MQPGVHVAPPQQHAAPMQPMMLQQANLQFVNIPNAHGNALNLHQL